MNSIKQLGQLNKVMRILNGCEHYPTLYSGRESEPESIARACQHADAIMFNIHSFESHCTGLCKKHCADERSLRIHI